MFNVHLFWWLWLTQRNNFKGGVNLNKQNVFYNNRLPITYRTQNHLRGGGWGGRDGWGGWDGCAGRVGRGGCG